MDFLRHLFPKNSPVRKIWYLCKAITACLWYRFPARQIKIVGITGTDGKTTTVEMISHILHNADIAHLKISTDSIFINGEQRVNETKRTTLSPWETQRLLREAVENKSEVAVLEVSSHAPEQWRIWGVDFSIAGITNITKYEHNEDHGGFENYAAAKKKLFTKYLQPEGTALLNADDEIIHNWDTDISQKKIWISTTGNTADVSAKQERADAMTTTFTLNTHKVQLPLLGAFQMQNAAVAFATATALELQPKIIVTALESFTGVAGRMESVDFGQPFAVYVDDAQTPNAVQKGLESLQKTTEGNVWVVFGCCGGGRDKAKRPRVGEVAGTLADFVVLTDDEPYEEPPEMIREDVKKGLEKTNIWNDGDDSPHFWEIPDRRSAIEFALQRAAPNDAVLIFGMGSYNTRNIGGKEIPWNDKQVVGEILGMNMAQKRVEQKQVQGDLEELKEKVVEK